MNLKIFLLWVIGGISGVTCASSCPDCKHMGRIKKCVTCEYCEGKGTLPPERFGKAAGVERWTETTYLATGVTTESEHKYKKYSDGRCPGCAWSTKRAGEYDLMATCNKCGGLGVIEPYNIADAMFLKQNLSAYVKVINGHSSDLRKEIKTTNKPTQRELQDVLKQTKDKVDDLGKKVNDMKTKVSASVTNKRPEEFGEIKVELGGILDQLDKFAQIQRHDKIAEKFSVLYTAAEWKKRLSEEE